MSKDPLEHLNYYELCHLVAHLTGAGRAEDLDRLLLLETDEGRNAWHRRKYAIGDVAGYLEDINEAWRLTRVSPSERSAAAVRGLRYALMVVSINSLSQSVPPRLTVAAVEKGIWSLEQGLTYARRCPDPKQRVEALKLLAPKCTPKKQHRVFSEAITTASSITSAFDSAPVLLALVDTIPDELKPTLIRAGLRLADQLSPLEIKEFFAAAPMEFRDELIPELLHAAQVVNDEGRLTILALLAPDLAPGLWPNLLQEVVAKIDDQSQLRDAADLLAKYLTADSLGAVLSWGHRADKWINYIWVGAFAPYADKQSLGEALETAGECTANERTHFEASEALISIAPYLDEASLARAFYIAQNLQDAEQKLNWLETLNHVTDQNISTKLTAKDMSNDLMHSKKISNKQTVPNEKIFPRAYRAELNHEQPEKLGRQASLSRIQVVAEIQDTYARYQELKQIVPRLAETVLPGLVNSLPDLVPDSPELELGLLSFIVPRLDEGKSDRALSYFTQLLSRIPSGAIGVNEALDRVAPYLSEVALRETLVLTRHVRDTKVRNDAMIVLLPYLRKETKEHVVGLSLELFYKNPLYFELPEMLPHLTEEQIESLLHSLLCLPDKDRIRREEQILDVTRGVPTGYKRVFEELLDIGPKIGKSRRHYLFQAIIPKVTGIYRKRAIAGWLAIGPHIIDVRVLRTIARYLTEAHLRRLMTMANQVKTARMRAERLGVLGAFLPMSLVAEAAEMAQGIEEKEYKVQALVELKTKAIARFSEEILQAKKKCACRRNPVTDL